MSPSSPPFVHESSYLDEGVEVGEGTMIWHFCHLLSGTRIGRKCRIGQNVVIGPRVRVGNNVKIQNNVSIYEGVELEDDVFCGPSMVFTNVSIPRSGFPRNTSADFLKTVVHRGASIGANATIVCGNTIGEFSMIGAGSVVTRSIPAYALVYGNPARQHGWVCQCGERLQLHAGHAQCHVCARGYRLDATSNTLHFCVGGASAA
jgi:UDP-2-acetamido-3-amino-2,3-dideoxy-glucuronate N-acetyltransferase